MSDFTSRLPRQLFTAAEVQSLDRIAIEDFAVPGFQLMQAAGEFAFSRMMECWPQLRHVLVFVGSGNNGGDGYIVAGLAREQNLSVTLIQLGDADKLGGDAAQAYQWAKTQKVAMLSWSDYSAETSDVPAQTVIVDALLGTGLDRDVAADYKQAIESINNMSSPVLSIDVPSGLNADTGASMGVAVQADQTVTFIGMKQGLLTNRGRDYCGDITFSNLDIADEIYQSPAAPTPSAQRLDINSVSQHLLPRARSSHKGNHGHVLVIAGDHEFGGAGIMAAEAAARTGAGLVSLVTRSSHRTAMLARRPEIMVMGTEDGSASNESGSSAIVNIDKLNELIDRASVIVIGPGLGNSKWSEELLQIALSAQLAKDIPLVVDADALNLLSARSKPLRRDNWILTPHPGEASRLLNTSIDAVQQDRFASVAALQSRWGGACLLKGSGSLICAASDSDDETRDQTSVYLSTEGNAGMASGGMGDVLSGIVAALVAQGHSLSDSLCIGVCVHGEAADLAVEESGQRGLLAADLFPFIRQLVNPVL